MAVRIAFFDAKSYDIESFNKVNEDYNFDIRYYQERLSLSTVPLAKGADVVCIFVNAECDARVIDELVKGAAAIDSLNENSKVLISEACTHAPLEEDIGRVKIPALLQNMPLP